MPNLAKQISYLLNWHYLDPCTCIHVIHIFYLLMIVTYEGYTYIFIFNYLVEEKCTEISAAFGKICHIKLYQRQCLSVRTITLLVRQIYFMIYHHSDLLCNTFVNDRPIMHKTAAFLYY